MAFVQDRELPLWRSLMFVPVNVEKFVGKASSCGADGIILDLEDSIAPQSKAGARELIRDAAKKVGVGGADVLVRINRPLELAVRDIEAAVCPEVTALMIPKVESAGHVRLLAEVVANREAALGIPIGRTTFFVLVETVQAFPHMFDIAAAHPRIVAFSCGTEDFTASVGAMPDTDVLLYPKQHAMFAARAAGVLPLGVLASGSNFRNIEAYKTAVANSRRFGFEGSACIHPTQVAILNEGFSPTRKEVDEAKRVVAAYDEALSNGRGAIGLDGAMLDVPVVERSNRILQMMRRIEARGDRTAQVGPTLK